MDLKRKIGTYIGMIAGPMVIIAQIFILFENELTTKQTIGAYFTIFTAICVIISVILNFIKKK